jgi:hypothetical protein
VPWRHEKIVDAAPSPVEAIRQAVQNIVNKGVVFAAGTGNLKTDISGSDFEYGNSDDIQKINGPQKHD